MAPSRYDIPHRRAQESISLASLGVPLLSCTTILPRRAVSISGCRNNCRVELESLTLTTTLSASRTDCSTLWATRRPSLDKTSVFAPVRQADSSRPSINYLHLRDLVPTSAHSSLSWNTTEESHPIASQLGMRISRIS